MLRACETAPAPVLEAMRLELQRTGICAFVPSWPNTPLPPWSMYAKPVAQRGEDFAGVVAGADEGA